MTAKNIAIAVVALLVLVVVLQHTETVESKTLFSMPRALMLFVHLLIGCIIWVLVGARLGRPAAKASAPETS